MRTIGAALLATTILASSALAATVSSASVGPLAPAKPAGVQKAETTTDTLLWLAGLGIVAGGIALAVSGGNNNNNSGSSSGTH